MIKFNKKIKNISILGLFLISSLFLTSIKIENNTTHRDCCYSKKAKNKPKIIFILIIDDIYNIYCKFPPLKPYMDQLD